jgi:quercetin dioxygenase-like cupin family protein
MPAFHRCTLPALVGAGLLVAGCDQTAAPTAVDHMSHGPNASTAATTQSLEPFTFRAPLDAFQIHQLPDFLMHSKNRSDIVIQRSVFIPGAGPWHTHPGPSFVYVIEGRIRLDRVVGQGECEATPVFVPGEAYFETGNQVHRAVVVSDESAVLMVVRFNIPVGATFTIPAADPGC